MVLEEEPGKAFVHLIEDVLPLTRASRPNAGLLRTRAPTPVRLEPQPKVVDGLRVFAD